MMLWHCVILVFRLIKTTDLFTMKWMALFVFLVACSVPESHKYDIGTEYVGVPYVADPLGEEMPPDTDPLMRVDAFDCTTFVETAVAGGDVEKLTRIRYKNGNIGFSARNHFIETDWLANNADFVTDVTAQYGKTAVRHVVIDKQNWFKVVHNIDSDVPIQTVDLNYIPYESLGHITTSEPLIVLFIDDKSKISDKIGTDLAVKHMGFLLPNGTFRHASSQYGRVMDVDFDEYVARRASGTNALGIMLVKIND